MGVIRSQRLSSSISNIIGSNAYDVGPGKVSDRSMSSKIKATRWRPLEDSYVSQFITSRHLRYMFVHLTRNQDSRYQDVAKVASVQRLPLVFSLKFVVLQLSIFKIRKEKRKSWHFCSPFMGSVRCMALSSVTSVFPRFNSWALNHHINDWITKGHSRGGGYLLRIQNPYFVEIIIDRFIRMRIFFNLLRNRFSLTSHIFLLTGHP